jgi:flagellar hook assembly protein FlgD
VQYGPRVARPSNPLATELMSNYPNPFNPITTLRFSLKEKSKVSLVIYDGKGRTVRTLVRPDRPMLPGRYRLIWDARDEAGMEVPSGQYFYRFTVPHYQKTRKMILVK